MLLGRTYTLARAALRIAGLAGLAALAGCPSNPPSPEPQTVDRIVIGGGSPPGPAKNVAVDPTPGGEQAGEAASPPPAPAPQEIAGEPPAPPLDPGVRDDRRGRLRPRARALLVAELQTLEALFQTVEKTSPERPKLAKRLAEDYGELAAAAEQELASRGSMRPDEAQRLAKVRDASRDRLIKYYTLLWTEHPNHCDRPDAANPAASTGCADEALYFIGYEHERAGKLDLARKSYLELIKAFPSSRFVALAYFGFGELYYDAARSDPSKWTLAAQIYAKVLALPSSPITPYAMSRLGLVCQKMNEHGASPPELCAKLKNMPAAKDAGGYDGQ